MKKCIKIFILVFMLFIFKDVNAVENCSTSEMNRLKELANNVVLSPKYEFAEDMMGGEENRVFLDYSIEIINLHEDLKLSYKPSSYEDVIELNSTQTIIDNLGQGSKITFYIYSYTDNLCTDELIKKVVVDLPIYNDYYYFNKEKCDLNPDFEYCKEFMNIEEKSFEEIDSLFDEFLKNDNVDDSKNLNNFFKYLIIAVIAIIVILLVLKIIFKIREIKKDDL